MSDAQWCECNYAVELCQKYKICESRSLRQSSPENDESDDSESMWELVYDPLGEQLEIIESAGIEPVHIANIISSYIGWIESTLDCEIAKHCVTCPPVPKGGSFIPFTSSYWYDNEICLVITLPQSSKCKYVLESVTIKLESVDGQKSPGDGTCCAKIELIDKMDESKSTGNVLFQKLNLKGGGKDSPMIKCDIDLELKCGESYLFYLEQTEQEIAKCEVNGCVSDFKKPEDRKRVEERRFVKDVVWARKYPYSIGKAWSLAKLSEVVFYHK